MLNHDADKTIVTLTALPTANSNFANKLYRLAVVGSADVLYMCQRQAGGSFAWLQVNNLFTSVADTASIDLTLAAGVLTADAIFGTSGTTVAVGNHTHAALYQPLDATLTALAAYNTNGLLTQTAADTFVGRTLTAPAEGFTITNPAGVAGNPTFVLANDLNGLENLATNGIAVRTATNTWLTRTIGAGTGITVTNGDGVSGAPSIAIDTAVVARKTDDLSVFASTTSAQLRTLLSDETGSGGAAVFATGPTLSAPTLTGQTAIGASGPTISSGSGSPEGVVTAPVGSEYLRTDGDSMTAAYRKADGAGTGGWIADDGFVRRRTERQIAKDFGAATMSTYGMTAPTLTGTLSNGDTQNGNMLNFATTAVSGNVASLVTPNLLRTDQGYEWAAFYVPIDSGNMRNWVGFFSGDPSGSDTPAVSMAAFRASTAASDTNWQCVTSDGSTRQITDSGVAVGTAIKILRVISDGTNHWFYINDVFITKITTPIPAGGTALAFRASLTTLTTTIKNMRVSYFRLLSR